MCLLLERLQTCFKALKEMSSFPMGGSREAAMAAVSQSVKDICDDGGKRK